MNAGWWVGLLLLAAWLLLKRARVSYAVNVTQNLRAPQAKVWAAIEDLAQWPRWSPWALHAPDADPQFERPRDVGGVYRWDGQGVGAGRITCTGRPSEHTLQVELHLWRPVQLKASTTLEVRELDALNTKARWTLSGQLPLYLAPMRPRLQRLLSQDLELGLLRLAGAVNPAASHPRLSFGEVAERVSFHAISHRESTTTQGLAQVFGEWLPQLKAQAGEACVDAPLGVYHRIDAQSDEVDLEIACPVPEGTSGAHVIRGGHYFKVTLQGDLKFLRLAWHAAHSQARMRQLKWDANSPALERYLSDPAQVPQPNGWITELYLPVQE